MEIAIPDDWREFLPWMHAPLLRRSTVALFGLGDQVGFPGAFVNGLGYLYDEVARSGARMIGGWPSDGYAFESSHAYRQGRFVGLPLDEHAQADQTHDRLTRWLTQVQREMSAAGANLR